MKKLTIKLQHKNIVSINGGDIAELEKTTLKKIPTEFLEYLRLYQGVQVNEFIYEDKEATIWVMGFILMIGEIKLLTKEFSEEYKRNLIPFSYDSGGWHFCLCMDEKDFGCIIVNRWTDYSEEEQFLKIADSFEEFIDGLQTDE